ncbi:TolB family protein [Marinicella rhabdoformis]|uniref:TolB family protein n=1 Tax=Marinicella rhabdoformis TaxID=2580566 RepID=UPI0012AEDC2B|nr:hypothetical protein [Marinicella rhabdoformis]
MHLILIFIAVVVLYLWWQNYFSQTNSVTSNQVPNHSDHYTIAFLSHGKIFCRKPAGDIKEIHSPFIQGVVERTEKSKQLHSWKEGTTFDVSAGGGMRTHKSANIELHATSFQFVSTDHVIYALKDNSVGGLFGQNLIDGTEQRLIHKQHLLLEDLAINPDGTQVLCTSLNQNGAANIGIINIDGSEYHELTSGDTIDTHPAWVQNEPHNMLFQSIGIARNEHGYQAAHGPASIQMLNTKEAELEAVKEAEDKDYLQPKVAPDGCLYFIQRPYEIPQYATKNQLTDTLLFPFRLLRALFHYLNFFSLMYSRKPLTSANGIESQADLKNILVKGKHFDAEQALKTGKKVNGVPSVVPQDWQLIRRTRYGEESVVANHVASYDIAQDGNVVFTNGYGVFVIKPGSLPTSVFEGKLITEVIIDKVNSVQKPT